jgi:hypothetical protein
VEWRALVSAAKPDRSTQGASLLLTLGGRTVASYPLSSIAEMTESKPSLSLERNGSAASVNSLLVIPKLKESGFTGHI